MALSVARAGVRGLPALLARARTVVQGTLGSPSGAAKLGAIGRRIGTAASSSRILKAMSNNKITTALVLMELGSEGRDLLEEMAAEDQDIAEMMSRYGVVNDDVSDDSATAILSQADELQCITDAANAVGGLNALHNLRRALGLTEAHYKLYDTVKAMRSHVS